MSRWFIGWWVALCVACGALSCSTLHRESLQSMSRSWMSVEEQIVSTTVYLAHEDAGARHAASGVLFKRDGRWYCWTAAHVAKDFGGTGTVTARVFRQGITDKRIAGKIVRVVAEDRELDLAIFELDLLEQGQGSAVIGRRTLRLGEPIINCGHSFGLTVPWSTVRGNVSQVPGEADVCNLKNGNFLGASTTSYPGCSGSGMWTLDGKLVGILSSGSGPGLIAFVHNDVMVRFAKDKNVEWAL